MLIIFCCIIPALPFKFDLLKIDWTAISSILTFCAIVISIISNQTAQKTLKATIAIQEQNKGLSLMEKRVTIIQAIKEDKPKSLKPNDILYYFDESCENLFRIYSEKHIKFNYKYQQYIDYFPSLHAQYFQKYHSQLSSRKQIDQVATEIDTYERLAKSVVPLDDQEANEYARLAEQYKLYDPDINDTGEKIDRFFSYDEVSDAYELALKEKNVAHKNLTDEMESLIFNSITLKI